MAHLILFTDEGFRGAHKHILQETKALSLRTINSSGEETTVNGDFPDGVSSIVILSGNWQFFGEENLVNPYPVVLGPGVYRSVNEVKLVNDKVRSMRPVADEPTMAGGPLTGHLTLFEHADFRGDHVHIFETQIDLDSIGDGFAGETSSIVVELGNWSFFFDTQQNGSYPTQPVLGPGIYALVEEIGITNDSVRSLESNVSAATISNTVDNHVVLFEYADLYGAHRHVYAAESNLNADNDSFFNDNVGSLAVLAGSWSFYSDWNFGGLYGDPGQSVQIGNFPDLSALGIDYDDMSSLRPTIPPAATPGTDILGHVVLFKGTSFLGTHKHVFNAEENLNADDDDNFNDSVSSLVVLEGNWKFYRDAGFNDDYPIILGPGLYSSVEEFHIRNDDLSSLQVVDEEPTMTGDPVTGHIVLFEHSYFRGAHKHIFREEDNLGSDEDAPFDDITSSIAVLAGTWWTFGDPNTQRQFKPFVGPGLYPDLSAVGIPNDDLTSLTLSDGPPTDFGQSLLGHAMLFEHEQFRGAHKHVFNQEDNLNADEDDSFNDATSSIVVLQNDWYTFRDAGFQRAYGVTLGEGLFRSVEDVGIANDDLSSLEVAGDRLDFTGTVTVNVKSGTFPDPISHEVEMTFLFHPNDGEILQVEHGFAPFDLDFTVYGVTPTIRYVGAQDGMFHLADGTMKILGVTIDISAGIDVILVVPLSTGSATSPDGAYMVTGSPFAQDPANTTIKGPIKLVGVGRSNDDDFSIELEGLLRAAGS